MNLVCITEGESGHRHKDDRGTKGRVKAWVDKKNKSLRQMWRSLSKVWTQMKPGELI